MPHPFVIAVCIPADFLNPYPALLLPAGVCAGLLSLGAFALFLMSWSQAQPIFYTNKLYQFANKATLVSAGWAWLLTGWLWWQSQLSWNANWCMETRQSFKVLVFTAAQREVGVTIALTVFMLVCTLVVAAIERKHRNHAQPGR